MLTLEYHDVELAASDFPRSLRGWVAFNIAHAFNTRCRDKAAALSLLLTAADGIISQVEEGAPPGDDHEGADAQICSRMSIEQRRGKANYFMQALVDARMNAFGFQLCAESVLKSENPIPVSFVFPNGREDCKQWAGVAISVTPIPVAEDD